MNHDLFSYPDHAGWKGDATSQAAAIGVNSKAKVIRQKVLDALKQAGVRGLTAEECAEIIKEDKSNVRPRLSELLLTGDAEKSNKTRMNGNGKQTRVYLASV